MDLGAVTRDPDLHLSGRHASRDAVEDERPRAHALGWRAARAGIASDREGAARAWVAEARVRRADRARDARDVRRINRYRLRFVRNYRVYAGNPNSEPLRFAED